MKKPQIDLKDIEAKIQRAAAEGSSPALIDVLRSLAQAVAAAPGPGASGAPPMPPPAPVLFDFVFAPGHPDPRPPNVFTAWGDLVAAANRVGGIPYVTFEDRHAAVVIPAGTWAFTCRPVFRGDPGRAGEENRVQVTVADGATLSGVRVFRDVDIRSASSAPVISSPPGENPVYVVEGSANLRADGTGPFIEHNVPQRCLLIVNDNAQLLAGASPVLRVGAAGEPVHVFTWGSGFVDANTISGVAGRTYGTRVSQSDGFIEPTQDIPPFGIAAGAMDQFVQHFPQGAPGSWKAQPFDVNSAIERLAAALVTRTGGTPIP